MEIIPKQNNQAQATEDPLSKYLRESGMMATKNFEGWEPNPYEDPIHEGLYSIGWGRLLGRNPDMNMTVTKESEQPIFIKQYTQAVKDAIDYYGEDFDSLSEAQQNVLIDMAYNMGGPRLKGFKGMLKALQGGDFARAALEMKYRDPDAETPEETPYYKQTGDRAKNHYHQIQQIGE